MLARFATACLIACLVAVLLTSGSWWEASSAASSKSGTPPYLVLIVMDGFRPDYMSLAPMHHLRELMARGRVYDSAWVGQLESETPAGHATIATGVYPRKHGVIGFGWRNPTTNSFTFMPTNLGEISAGQLTQVIESGGVPTLSDLVHARNRRDLAISISGEKLWASAPMGAGADYLLYGREVDGTKARLKFQPLAVGPNQPPARTKYTSVGAPDSAFDYQDGFAARLAVSLVDKLRPRALLLNLPATDIAGHYYGGMSRPQDMASIISGADRAIGDIMREYQHLGILNKTLFVVTADHGMVAGRHRVPIHSVYKVVGHAGVQEMNESLRSSMGAIWLRDPEHAPMLASKLTASHFQNVEGVLYKVPSGTSWKFQAAPATAKKLPHKLLQAYLDLANTEASPSGADLLMPYPEDTTGLPVTHKFKGMHGGFSWGAQHIPLILAGPGVKPGVSHYPAKLVDIAPTIEHLAGLQTPPGVDGVVLADGVQHPTGKEMAAQKSVQGQRTTDERALEAHSAAQQKGVH